VVGCSVGQRDVRFAVRLSLSLYKFSRYGEKTLDSAVKTFCEARCVEENVDDIWEPD
jgi:hypothetical protein